MKVLQRVQFGNPRLREESRKISEHEIASKSVQQLATDMRYTLVEKKLGIGLAAPQVGKNIALVVIAIRPTEHSPNVKNYDLVLINPVITSHASRRKHMWEGCISAGSKGTADLFAKVPRYEEIKVSYCNEKGEKQHRTFKGLKAQVIQHEVDHLNGVLFVDRVNDPKTFMTYKEYIKQIKQGESQGTRLKAK